MARITSEQRERNLERYNNAILELFRREGWEYISYRTLAKETGVSKSTLLSYYPTSKHFGLALQGKIAPFLMGALDFSSNEAFIESWDSALKSNDMFRQSIKMTLLMASREHKGQGLVMALVRFEKEIDKRLPNQGKVLLARVLGESVLRLIT